MIFVILFFNLGSFGFLSEFFANFGSFLFYFPEGQNIFYFDFKFNIKIVLDVSKNLENAKISPHTLTSPFLSASP